MGVTIHYKTDIDNLDTAIETVEFVRLYAAALHIPHKIYHEDGRVRVERMMDFETGDQMDELLMFYTEEQAVNWDMDGEISKKFGVMLNFSKPVQIETFDFGWFKYQDSWHLRGFCKTQVFDSREMSNFYAHITIIGILMTIKQTWISNLHISDEGDYYLPLDKGKRDRWIDEHVRDGYKERYRAMEVFDFKNLVEAHGENLDLIKLTLADLKDKGFKVE